MTETWWRDQKLFNVLGPYCRYLSFYFRLTENLAAIFRGSGVTIILLFLLFTDKLLFDENKTGFFLFFLS